MLFIKDENTLLLKNFEYDGEGPDAFFYVGTDGDPSAQALRSPLFFRLVKRVQPTEGIVK